jgi:hypothetical protein
MSHNWDPNIPPAGALWLCLDCGVNYTSSASLLPCPGPAAAPAPAAKVSTHTVHANGHTLVSSPFYPGYDCSVCGGYFSETAVQSGAVPQCPDQPWPRGDENPAPAPAPPARPSCIECGAELYWGDAYYGPSEYYRNCCKKCQPRSETRD